MALFFKGSDNTYYIFFIKFLVFFDGKIFVFCNYYGIIFSSQSTITFASLVFILLLPSF